jgi:hypothetical protein
MFGLVLDRIQRETEHLYPLIRKVEDKPWSRSTSPTDRWLWGRTACADREPSPLQVSIHAGDDVEVIERRLALLYQQPPSSVRSGSCGRNPR